MGWLQFLFLSFGVGRFIAAFVFCFEVCSLRQGSFLLCVAKEQEKNKSGDESPHSKFKNKKQKRRR
jgi:hypothetical protein